MSNKLSNISESTPISYNLFKMKRASADALAEQVVHFFDHERNQDKVKTCHHLMAEGMQRRTISKILGRYEDRGTVNYLAIPGRPAKIATTNVIKQVQGLLTKTSDTSIRRGSQELKISKSTFHRIKGEKLGFNTYKKQSVPKYRGNQEARAKTACRKIYRQKLLSVPDRVLLIDDETYVPVDKTQLPGMEYFHCQCKSLVPDKFRFKPKEKYPTKYLVWQCLDEDGHVSDPYITQGTMNAETYLNECLRKRLLPFIQKYHDIHKILFWPDMASCHYQRSVITWLKDQNINFVDKCENAANVPQARPIERFWALCKAEYKRRKTPARNLNLFKRIWKNIAVKVAAKIAQRLMKSARQKLRTIGYKGVRAPFH